MRLIKKKKKDRKEKRKAPRIHRNQIGSQSHSHSYIKLFWKNLQVKTLTTTVIISALEKVC